MALPTHPAPGTPLTAEDLYVLPGDARRYELVRGQLRVAEPPGLRHGVISALIAARLLAHVQPRRLGTVAVESGYVLQRGPDTVRGPDVTFLAAERQPPAERAHRFVEGAPDLAVEVVSPGDRPSEIAEKVDEYLASGTRLVWVIYPDTRRIAVHDGGRATRLLRVADTLDGGDVLPGFACPVAELFPESDAD